MKKSEIYMVLKFLIGYKSKKALLIFFLTCFSLTNLKAQLVNGSVAPDFTLTDINGTSHNLNNYLNSGKKVVMCNVMTWVQMNAQNAFYEELWEQHGPLGEDGVLPTSSNDLVILLIEVDCTTDMNDLLGIDPSSTQDWVTGNHYPIINATCQEVQYLNYLYNLNTIPLVYSICPYSKITTNITYESIASDAIYHGFDDCPAVVVGNDFGFTNSTLSIQTCLNESYDIQVEIKNFGTSTLTNSTIVVKNDGVIVSSVDWEGSLEPYESTMITMGAVDPMQMSNCTVEIISSDQNSTNNSMVIDFISYPQATASGFKIQFITDGTGWETTWKLKNSNGIVVASINSFDYQDQWDPFNDDPTPFIHPEFVYNTSNPNECYTLLVEDANGNGINFYNLPTVGYTVKDLNDNLLVSSSNNWSSFVEEHFVSYSSNGSSQIDEISSEDFIMYPNPTKDNINIRLKENTESCLIVIEDMAGTQVFNNTFDSTVSSTILSIPVGEFSSGFYLLKINSNGKQYVKKINKTN